MIAGVKTLIAEEVASGTGAAISVSVEQGRRRKALAIWFDDLGRNASPIVELRPAGLRRHKFKLTFGKFAKPTIEQMMRCGDEALELARALVQTAASKAEISALPHQDLQEWIVSGSDFCIEGEIRAVEAPLSDDAFIQTVHEVIVPILGAMAELIGYEEIPADANPQLEAEMEGAVTIATVKRRERNPRNRLLCLRLHGEECKVCGLDPLKKYAGAGGIIEVHHIQPLSVSGAPRPYDPRTDLVPLCPNCHRAVHTQRPLPISPEELRAMIS